MVDALGAEPAVQGVDRNLIYPGSVPRFTEAIVGGLANLDTEAVKQASLKGASGIPLIRRGPLVCAAPGGPQEPPAHGRGGAPQLR